MYRISLNDAILASDSGVFVGGVEPAVIGPFGSAGCGNRFKSFSIIVS